MTFEDQTTDGTTVVVASVNVSDGGYVVIHNETLFEGDAVESVVGHSEYLEPGAHENVTVTLDEPLNESQTLVAMPHLDTNDNQTYDFSATNGTEDAPYVENGTPVIDEANVTVEAAPTTPTDNATVNTSVTFEDQSSDGSNVTVTEVNLSEGGFVVIHDSSLQEGDAVGSVIGASDYLEPGSHENVNVTLDEPLNESETLVAMAHRDTNDNQTYDFSATNGTEDVPYTENGTAITSEAFVVVTQIEPTPPTEQNATVTFDDQTSDGTNVTVSSVNLSEPGFVVMHDSTLYEGDAVGSVVGHSEYLEAGSHENVTVPLDEPLAVSQLLVAMPHLDTNDNQTYDFSATNGTEDVPVTQDGAPITDEGFVTVNATEPTDNVTDNVTEPTDNVTDNVTEPTDNVTDNVTEPTDNVTEPTDNVTANESFTVSNLSAPANATVGDTISVTADITNPNDATATQDVDFRLQGDVVQRASVTLSGNLTDTVHFEVNTSGVPPGTYVHGVYTDDFGQIAEITLEPEVADNVTEPTDNVTANESFTVSNLSAPANATVGDTISVAADITNPNDATVTQEVEFRLDGDVVRTATVTLSGDLTDTLLFEIDTTGVPPGTYVHGVFAEEDNETAEITLEEECRRTTSPRRHPRTT
ncbi:hypothetical protein ACFQH6_01425 [Halobacteriaceae archaeon GCM10025711]